MKQARALCEEGETQPARCSVLAGGRVGGMCFGGRDKGAERKGSFNG